MPDINLTEFERELLERASIGGARFGVALDCLDEELLEYSPGPEAIDVGLQTLQERGACAERTVIGFARPMVRLALPARQNRHFLTVHATERRAGHRYDPRRCSQRCRPNCTPTPTMTIAGKSHHSRRRPFVLTRTDIHAIQKTACAIRCFGVAGRREPPASLEPRLIHSTSLASHALRGALRRLCGQSVTVYLGARPRLASSCNPSLSGLSGITTISN
jgi:hypothetical protein